ncbi:type II toxin-antitoxin system RelE/ParE family toxin [Methylobacterium sp. 174MFSha1.1]|uniref:type II toxin-antitoxin system RelE/ParE family toxin n=1 Tax=Methylobacterium sp. 174MFSha1.1 TaxID=1502749 RepID=UPI001FCD2EAC|nr:type II toxin-antitoxin system RelE/ParE family toxin [Methylobacterium sp. 174MFSha1.1]
MPKFSKDAAKSGIRDADLLGAVARAESGLIDAGLGLCLIKQRVARPGQGRSGGFRTILFHKRRERAVFLYVFPKNVRANVTPGELDALRDFATILAGLTDEAFDRLTREKGWKVIPDEHPEDDVSQ